jgi:hypothetical protein
MPLNYNRAPIVCLAVVALFTGVHRHVWGSPSLTLQTPSDARSNQFVDVNGASWRVFAVDSHPTGPLVITQVEEIRQQNPPSLWAVYVRNRMAAPVVAGGLAAAIVTGDGNVKAIQQLPAIRNLKPNQVNRREMRVTATVLTPTDRVVFYISDVSDGREVWKAADPDVAALIKSAAKRLPIP